MQYTLSTSAGPVTVEATEPVPGLRVFETPENVSPLSSYRWVLAHHDGAAVLASFETEAAATDAAHAVAHLADWTRTAMTAANEISLGGNVERFGFALIAHGGAHPNA